MFNIYEILMYEIMKFNQLSNRALCRLSKLLNNNI